MEEAPVGRAEEPTLVADETTDEAALVPGMLTLETTELSSEAMDDVTS